MAKARKGSVVQSKLMMLLYGEQFTGKSTMALQLCYLKRPDGKPFRVLYIDNEGGGVDDFLEGLENNGINLDNLYIVYTQSLSEVRQYIATVKSGEDFYVLDDEGNETDEVLLDADGEPFRADAIVVDGTTVLNLTTKQGLVEFSKKRNKIKADKEGLIGDARLVKVEGAGMELRDYQTVNFKGQDLVLDLMASGVHCIVTARETDEKIQVKQPDGTVTSVNTGRKIPDGFKGMGYNVKTEIRMYHDPETNVVCAHVIKDRTGVHKDNDKVEDPTLLDWQVVIDKTANKKAFVLKNDLTKAVNIEQDIYAQEVMNGVNKSITNEAPTSTTEPSMPDVSAIKAEILAKKNALAPDKKNALKSALEAAGLPIAFKNVNDIDILNKVLDVIKANS